MAENLFNKLNYFKYTAQVLANNYNLLKEETA